MVTMRQNYTFVQGVMDKDTDQRLIKKGVFIDMKNAISYNGRVFKPKGMLMVKDISTTPIAAKIYDDVMVVFAYDVSYHSYIYKIDLTDFSTAIETVIGPMSFYLLGDSVTVLDIDIFEDATNDRFYIYWTDDDGFPKFIEANQAINNPEYRT